MLRHGELMEPNAPVAAPKSARLEIPLASKYGTLGGGTKQRPDRTIERTTAAARTTYWLMLLLPFTLFTTASASLAFLYFSRPGDAVTVVIACFIVPVFFHMRSRGAATAEEVHHGTLLAMSNGMAVLFGAAFGYLVFSTIFFNYEATMNAATYGNVSPKQRGMGLMDAGRISFTSETWVDGSRSVGYTAAGGVYCVAPVIDSAIVGEIEYWAVGEDCCDMRGGFRCGDLNTPAGKQKPTIVDIFPAPEYIAAANLALAENDLKSANGALFVRFVADTDAYLHESYVTGIAIYVTGVLFAAGTSVFSSELLAKLL